MDAGKSSIIMRCYDLLKYHTELIKQFPRDHKFTLGDRIYTLCADLLELYIEAYYKADKPLKKELLHRANIQLEKLRLFVRLAYENKLFTSGKYREASENIQELGRMTGAWIKSL